MPAKTQHQRTMDRLDKKKEQAERDRRREEVRATKRKAKQLKQQNDQ